MYKSTTCAGFKKLLIYVQNISYLAECDMYKVKLLLLRLVVKTSSHVAPYIQVSSVYLNPEWIGSNYLSYKFGGSKELIIIIRLKPTGHVMHQQFNIQQFYVLPTFYLCVLYLFEDKQRLVPHTS